MDREKAAEDLHVWEEERKEECRKAQQWRLEEACRDEATQERLAQDQHEQEALRQDQEKSR